MPIASNPQTGETMFLADDGAWKPAQTAVNPQTKQLMAHDGQAWVDIPVKSRGVLDYILSNVQKAVEPITSYPETYGQMNREARSQIGEGVDQLTTPPQRFDPVRDAAPPDSQAWRKTKGAANAALGTLGYVASPVTAAIRTVVGKPFEEATGIPKEYTEFAAAMALPVPKRIPTISRPAARPTALGTEQLFDAADRGYEAARGSPVVFHPTAVGGMADGIAAKLSDQGYRDFLAPKTFRALEEFKRDTPSNVSDIDAVRKALNKAAADPAERDAARRAVTEIDAFLAPKVPAIADARANYAAAKRSELIEDAMDRAQRQANSAGSGQNLDNAMRQQIKSIRNSQSKSRGFSADELAQMDRVIEGTYPGDAARFMGNLLGGGGGIGTAVTGAMTAGVAPVFGYAFKKLGNAVTSREVGKLEELVRSRAPEAKAVSSSVADWSTAAQTFETSPSMKNFARLSIASRNLSNNLGSAQIRIAPDDIMRSLQGPVKSAAEGEEPAVPGRPSE